MQSHLDQQAIDLLLNVAQVILDAPTFEANQMRVYALREINDMITPLLEMNDKQKNILERYLLGIFNYKQWTSL
jgi:hypothetical protein